MNNEQCQQLLALQQAAEAGIDARLEKIVDRSFRSTDQTLNGTVRSFMMEAALLQRLPFQPGGSENNVNDSTKTG